MSQQFDLTIARQQFKKIKYSPEPLLQDESKLEIDNSSRGYINLLQEICSGGETYPTYTSPLIEKSVSIEPPFILDEVEDEAPEFEKLEVNQLVFNHDELFIKKPNKRQFEVFIKNNHLDELEQSVYFDEKYFNQNDSVAFDGFQPLSNTRDMHQEVPAYDALQYLGPDFDHVPVYEPPKVNQLEKMEELLDFELWEDTTVPLQSDPLFDFKPLSVLRKSPSFVENDKVIGQLLLKEGFDSVTQYQIAVPDIDDSFFKTESDDHALYSDFIKLDSSRFKNQTQLSWNLEKSLAVLNIDFSFERLIFNSDNVDFVKRYENCFDMAEWCNWDYDIEEEMLIKIEDCTPMLDNFKVPQERPKFEPTKALENFLHLKGIKKAQVPAVFNFKKPAPLSSIDSSEVTSIKPATIITIAPIKRNTTQHKYLAAISIFKNCELIKLIEEQNVLILEREFEYPYIIIDSRTVIM